MVSDSENSDVDISVFMTLLRIFDPRRFSRLASWQGTEKELLVKINYKINVTAFRNTMSCRW
jgi:hypothetical protein